MGQTAEHRSYVRSRAVRSCQGPSPARHSTDHRLGFTLVEVVVAMAILLIVVLALVSSYSFYYGRTVQLRAATIGQNLAQLDLEDIRSYSKTQLYSLCGGDGIYPNYRAETPSDPGGPSSEVYDVGKVAGTFYIPKITAVLGQQPAEWNSISSSIDLPPGVIDLAPAGPSYVDYTMVLMESVFPGYQRRVVITEAMPVNKTNFENNTFRINVTVYWTFAGKTRSYTVSTEK
jgi:prepilin-type N-terminal cleavage/methylation domain-containing protein